MYDTLWAGLSECTDKDGCKRLISLFKERSLLMLDGIVVVSFIESRPEFKIPVPFGSAYGLKTFEQVKNLKVPYMRIWGWWFRGYRK